MSPTKAFNRGLIAGVSMSFVGGIGMVQAFNPKILISPILPLGYFVLYGLPAVVAWVSTKREVLEGLESEPPNLRDVLSGALIGLVGGVFLGLYIWLIDSVNVRETFPNMGPPTVTVLTFGKDLGVGIGLAILTSTLAGTAGAAIRLDPRPRPTGGGPGDSLGACAGLPRDRGV